MRLYRKSGKLIPAILLVTAAILLCSPASASSILIGSPTDFSFGNCIPFGCVTYGPGTIYQQVYASTAFTAPLMIRTLSFLNTVSPTGTIIEGTYSFSLSTTSRSVNGLSTDFASNVGSDSQLFWEGTLSGTVNGSMVVSGTPFEYLPSMGNLLLQIRYTAPSSLAPVTSGGVAFDSRNGSSAGTFSRISDYYNSNLSKYNNNYGLATLFSDGRGAPEPSSLLLLPAGLAAIFILRKRRRSVRP